MTRKVAVFRSIHHLLERDRRIYQPQDKTKEKIRKMVHLRRCWVAKNITEEDGEDDELY